MTAVLEARDLGRWYGQVVGLNDLTATIGPGITGLLGPNGAGKSTFLKLIAGELRPSSGRLEVLGHEPFANRELYRRVGFAPQQDALYDDLTGLEFVTLLVRLHGYGAREARDRARRALGRAGLDTAMDRRCAGYSKGMRQRTRLAQAIACDPELVVADEPLTGLDPVGRREVLELFRELAEGGVHLIVSSHVLHEVEALTEEILLLHRGRLLAQGSVGEIRDLLDHHPRRVELEAREPRALARALLAFDEVAGVTLAPGHPDAAGGRLIVETRDVQAFQRHLTATAAELRAGVRSLESTDASLEAVFDYLVR